MRYRFRGLNRDTGRPVEGHVEEESQERAFIVLAEQGIVTEALTLDPRQPTAPADPGAATEQTKFASAIDSALDTASSQVSFDTLANKFKGKNVWVIDRDKIRKRVAQVVDGALQDTMGTGGDDVQTRQRVAEAIDGLFRDNKNITSRASEANQALERQINRLANVITKAESLVATMSSVLRTASMGGGGGGGGYAPRRYKAPQMAQEQGGVLLEIFKSNLELLRGLETTGITAGEAVDANNALAAEAAQASPATEATSAPASS